MRCWVQAEYTEKSPVISEKTISACASQWLRSREGSWRAVMATEAMIAAYELLSVFERDGRPRMRRDGESEKAEYSSTNRDSNHVTFLNV